MRHEPTMSGWIDEVDDGWVYGRYGPDGLPGFVTREADGILQTTALLVEGEQVRAIYVMRNPDKLAHLGEGRVH